MQARYHLLLSAHGAFPRIAPYRHQNISSDSWEENMWSRCPGIVFSSLV